jgi:hypothetical protein
MDLEIRTLPEAKNIEGSLASRILRRLIEIGLAATFIATASNAQSLTSGSTDASHQAGAPAGAITPTYMKRQFGIPQNESDCDTPETPVLDTMSEPVRRTTQTLNAQARQLCRGTFEQHRIEQQTEATIAEAEALEAQAASIRAMSYANSPEDRKGTEQSKLYLRRSLEREARQHQIESCEVREVEILKDKFARGDTLGAQAEQDKIRRNICANVGK